MPQGEGYDAELSPSSLTFPGPDAWVLRASLHDKEELAYKLLSSLPISNLARLQRKIAPLLQLDIIGLLATEISLYIFSYLPPQTLLACALVSRRWRILADDPSLWKRLCTVHGWQWREAPLFQDFIPAKEFDDEGVGEDEDDGTNVDAEVSMSNNTYNTPRSSYNRVRSQTRQLYACKSEFSLRRSAPAAFSSQASALKPDYKLLHQTHTLLRNRIFHSSYRLTYLQTSQTPNSHTSTIYCLQLHTFPDSVDSPGRQVLFTGSRDLTIRQWDLSRGIVERIFKGIHEGSVLSLCVRANRLVSGGNDARVVVWDLETGEAVKTIQDHLDSVPCVRLDDKRLVSCSKDQTIRTYLLPDLSPHLVLDSHRAAVNAIAISPTHIVSASGDRSIRLWDPETGDLLHCFERHHNRGIASLDFSPPYILSGSSDKQLRFFNVLTSHGWSTSSYLEPYAQTTPASNVCQACGNADGTIADALNQKSMKRAQTHKGMVRSVVIGNQFVVSGSYDQTIKVWDRTTGEPVADLMGGHNGKIFSIAADCTKIVSCGDDQRICIWDFAHGISTSFIQL
ncbi:WD40 repeat-like protein [Ramaria rubella]|nr:WD40 repeat-like protein [Ramaria rubella]